MSRLERTFRVLGNRRRLAILRLLMARKRLTVADIAEAIKLSFTSTSKHLRLLDHAGIVEPELAGRYVYYRLAQPDSPMLKTLLGVVAHSRE